MNEANLRRRIEGFKGIQESFASLNGENVGHGDFTSILEDCLTIFERCPFGTGDRVQLEITPVINDKEAWGWMGSKHFLAKGAKATVTGVEFRKGKFIFGLEFDDDSWVHPHTKEVIPNDRKALYYFSEYDIVRAKE